MLLTSNLSWLIFTKVQTLRNLLQKMQWKWYSELPNGIFLQICATVTGSLVAASDGMQLAWTSPVAEILLSEDSHIKTSQADLNWIESLMMIGLLCGMPVTVFILNKIGQKKSLILSSVMSLTLWVIIALANKVEYLFFARFFYGLSTNIAYVAGPIYIAEIADKNVRGFLINLLFTLETIGNLIIYIITKFVPFYVPSIIAICFCVIEIIIFPFMPESPYYLLYKSKPEKAKKSLLRLRCTDNVDGEFREISEAVERQSRERGRPQDLFLISSNRKAFIIITVLSIMAQMTGDTVIIMNLHTLLSSSKNAYYGSFIYVIIIILCGLASSYLTDKYGRRSLLIISSILTGFSLLSFSVYFTLDNEGYNVSRFNWIPIISVFFYAVFYKIGLGMMPFIYPGELYPMRVKSLGVTLGDATFGLSAIVSLQIYHILSDVYGIQYPFYIFSLCSFITTIFTIFCVPETKGKSLDEIQFILKGKKGPDAANSSPQMQR